MCLNERMRMNERTESTVVGGMRYGDVDLVNYERVRVPLVFPGIHIPLGI